MKEREGVVPEGVLKFTMRPGHFYDAASWIHDQYQERERQRLPRYFVPGRKEQRHSDQLPLPSLSRLRMGRLAFMEAKRTHASDGIYAVDYCDFLDDRVRIGRFAAEPDGSLPDWDIELD